jgi:hypothetical protein
LPVSMSFTSSIGPTTVIVSVIPPLNASARSVRTRFQGKKLA